MASHPQEPSDSLTPSVGEVLSVSAAHLRGLHDAPRDDCWRCRREAGLAALDSAGTEGESAVAEPEHVHAEA